MLVRATAGAGCTLSNGGGRTAYSSRVNLCPRLDGRTKPNASYGEAGFGRREVGVGLDELVGALLRDTEHLGDLGDAHQVVGHLQEL